MSKGRAPAANSRGKQDGRPFTKGRSGNPAGRKKGVPNKVTKTVKQVIAAFVEGNAHTLQARMDEIKEPVKWVETYLKVLEYYLPKLSRVDVPSNGGGPVVVMVTETDRKLAMGR